MVANTNFNLSSKLQPEIAVLRTRLKELNVWPAAGDQFLLMLAQTRLQPDKSTPNDQEWIVQVAQDALLSCDIGARYPAFFQKLLRCPDLLEAFLVELDQQQTHWHDA